MKRIDMKAAAKFRAVCECGAEQARATTFFTAERWMRKHEQEHREEQART